MEIVINIERFIDDVKSRSSIWDCSSEEYKDRDLKKRQWNEICNIFHPELEMSCAKDKVVLCTGLQSKWKNIKDCYRKYLKSLKTKSGQARKNVKTYLYAEQLSFMRNVVAVGPTEPSPNVEQAGSPEDDVSDVQACDIEEARASASTVHRRRKRTLEGKLESYIDTLQTAQVPAKNDDCDDMSFFRSLLPMVKPLPSSQKMRLRMDIMQMVYDISTCAPNVAPTIQSSSGGHLSAPNALFCNQSSSVQEDMSQPNLKSQEHRPSQSSVTSYHNKPTPPVFHDLQVPDKAIEKLRLDCISPQGLLNSAWKHQCLEENSSGLFSAGGNPMASSATTEVSDCFSEEGFS